jgi:hypothetical protein
VSASVSQMPNVSCSHCGTTFESGEQRCPSCGSGDRSVDITDAAGCADTLSTKARHGEPRQVRPFLLIDEDIVWNHDRQRMERRRMVHDRDRNYKSQVWTSLETGETTWHKEGELTDPKMQGKSARRSKSPA